MVRVKLDNSHKLFKPGMYAHLTMDSYDVAADVTVPREAVTTNKKGVTSVTSVDSDQVAHVVPVTVGVQDANNIQILSGLKAGEKVIVLSYRPVKDKSKVTEAKIGESAKSGGKRIRH
jgi:multidrug efflux pump subunit AcrA (membrane-fusion protein)